MSEEATGWRKLITDTPSGRAATSSREGGWTRATAEAPASASAAVPTTAAPAWR